MTLGIFKANVKPIDEGDRFDYNFYLQINKSGTIIGPIIPIEESNIPNKNNTITNTTIRIGIVLNKILTNSPNTADNKYTFLTLILSVK